MLHPTAVGRVPRVLGEAGQADHLAQPRPLALAADGDGQLAVGRPEGLVGNEVRMRVAHATRRDAADERVLGLVDERRERRFEERHVDPLASHVLPRQRVAREQAREDRDGAEEPGHHVADRDPHLGRSPAVVVGRSRDRHQAADRLHDEVVAGLGRVRAVRAEARDREVHEVGVDRRQGGVVEPEPREPADAVVLDQDVGLGQEAAKDAAAGLRLEVEADRALVAVHGQEVGRGLRAGRLVTDPRRAPAARRVALRRLDLDDVRAEVAQDHRAIGPREDRRAIRDADPGEGSQCGVELAAALGRAGPARRYGHRSMVAARASGPCDPCGGLASLATSVAPWDGRLSVARPTGRGPNGGTGPTGPTATHRLLTPAPRRINRHGDHLVRALRVRRDRRDRRRPRHPLRRGVARRLRALRRRQPDRRSPRAPRVRRGCRVRRGRRPACRAAAARPPAAPAR